MLDDFEGTGGTDNISALYSLTDQTGTLRDGTWSAQSGTGATIITSGTGNPGTAIEYATSISASYAQLTMNLLSSANPYDATVGGRYYGISFSAKINSLPTNIACNSPGGNGMSTMAMYVDFVDNQTPADHIVAIPVTVGWQNYTIYFDQAGFDANLDANSLPLIPTSLIAIKFQPQSLGTNGFNFDFLIDNIQLVSTTDPGAPVQAINPKMIDDFENGDNQVILNSGGKYYAPTSTGRSGYWFAFADGNGTGTSECPNGIVGGSTLFVDSPGYGGTTGDPGFAAHFTGAIGAAGPPYCYAGLGFDFNGANSAYDATGGGTYTGVQFYWKNDPGTATACSVGFQSPDTNAAEGSDIYQDALTGITTTWTLVQIPLECTTCTPAGPLKQQGFGTAVAWTPTQVYGMQWEFANGQAGQNFGLWIDNLSFY